MQDPYYEEDLEDKYLTYLSNLWKQNWLFILAWLLSGLLLVILSWLYSIPFDIAWMFMLISGFGLMIYLGFYLRRLHDIKHLLHADNFEIEKYPEELRSCVLKMQQLSRQIHEVKSQARHDQSELEDYFSMWAHEVKLPLAAMELQLSLPQPDLKEIANCEKRISHFVQQAMIYVRLDGSDYRIQKVNLEEVVRPLIREQSATFFARKLILDCDLNPCEVYTDRKWIAYVIEQLFANAIKYSQANNTITIKTEDNSFVIYDEGCGINPEDLPRIFEKGFTGKNGHNNITSSSGLGLYLSAKVCDKLGCTLTIENRDYTLYPAQEREDEDPSSCPTPSKTGVVARIQFPPALFFRA